MIVTIRTQSRSEKPSAAAPLTPTGSAALVAAEAYSPITSLLRPDMRAGERELVPPARRKSSTSKAVVPPHGPLLFHLLAMRVSNLELILNARGMTERSEEHTSELQSLMRISY